MCLVCFIFIHLHFHIVKYECVPHLFCCLVTQCVSLCDSMDWSMPGFSVLHYLPEFAQTHIHRVYDDIQFSSSVIAFSSCPQPFPASESFPMGWLFMSGNQSTGASDPHPLKHCYRDKSSSIYVDWATEMPIKYKTVCDPLHI